MHHKWQSHDVWFLRYGAQQRIFCHLGSFFGLLHPYGPRKSKFSTKKNQKKKTSGDIIILHNVHHMVYGSCDMECNRQTFFVILDHFLPFLKRWKNHGISFLQICTINDNHMMYGSCDMDHDRQTFLSFWTIFCPFTPLTTPKIIIFKKWNIVGTPRLAGGGV